MSLNCDILLKLASLDKGVGSRDELEMLYPSSGERAELLVAVRPDEYSAAVLARAVEDCDVHLVNMNLTPMRTDEGLLVVALRVDCTGTDAIERSLERYGYMVLDASGNRFSIDDEESRRRAAELLHMLEL